MKKMLVVMLAVALVVGLTAVANAAPTSKPAGLHGKIKSVDVDKKEVVVTTKERGATETKDVTVTVDDKTTITIDGETKALADLKADMRVKVTPATGTATEIKATTKKPGKGGKKGGAEG